MNKKVYQLYIELLDIQPGIWRRLLVPADIRLSKLHLAIQAAMGWTNSHLHEFEIGKDRRRIGLPTPDDMVFGGAPIEDERKLKLSDVAEAGESFFYTYDFGDDWRHKVVIEQIQPAEPRKRYPICLEGARACPPEDCGGPPGYEHLLAALANKKHPEHKTMKEWVGGGFEAGWFALGEVNAALKRACR